MSDLLYKKLNILRQKIAHERQVELYRVWNNETQKLISELKPTTLKELESIKGMGPAKIRSFGNLILTILDPQTEELEKEPVIPTDIEGEKVLSVAVYLDYVNFVLKTTETVKVFGEIFTFQEHQTGIYLTIKDNSGEAVMDCYMSPYHYKAMGANLEVGMAVKLTGFAQVFKRKGKFSFNITDIELVGEGSLKQAYDILKKKLAEQGIFERKRLLPDCISNIAVITSRTGAVIDDFRKNVINLGLNIHLRSVRVEGKFAEQEIINAIQSFNKNPEQYECIVLMRGGGSLEDLQAFNQESVVRAVFGSRIPVIAAIGHDRDIPLVCLAADRFTSTPTAAAMLINTSWQASQVLLLDMEQKLRHSMNGVIMRTRTRLGRVLQENTVHLSRIFLRFQRIKHLFISQGSVFTRYIEAKHNMIAQTLAGIMNQLSTEITHRQIFVEKTLQLLEQVNPERALKLGYAILSKQDKILRSVKEVIIGDDIDVLVSDGTLNVTVKALKYDK